MTQAFTKCPFCAEEVKANAVVCKHCRYDLTVVREPLARIDALSGIVAAGRGCRRGCGFPACSRA
jgi:hypothetical protein